MLSLARRIPESYGARDDRAIPSAVALASCCIKESRILWSDCLIVIYLNSIAARGWGRRD